MATNRVMKRRSAPKAKNGNPSSIPANYGEYLAANAHNAFPNGDDSGQPELEMFTDTSPINTAAKSIWAHYNEDKLPTLDLDQRHIADVVCWAYEAVASADMSPIGQCKDDLKRFLEAKRENSQLSSCDQTLPYRNWQLHGCASDAVPMNIVPAARMVVVKTDDRVHELDAARERAGPTAHDAATTHLPAPTPGDRHSEWRHNQQRFGDSLELRRMRLYEHIKRAVLAGTLCAPGTVPQ
ncbi:hypothetical protein BDY17DRAFT_150231 [Neohortaea acidophila]|uniref:Uncharacterized protein n=1 Tax=Neohortaea acidophila TaxID=245834 RepID=A0A6A6PW92_9PEZI|nr:uncharacterized protein BDY17DRAFT_150231 [Neohortaea acidophila]KAF2483567.1 hypothetical protein BDY17DRAFT_150231 [Neohortaea acidophila]